MAGREDKEGGNKDEKAGNVAAAMAPQSKGKKNAYSNSVQKMTCPYCPRVFPWASSLQRHMLTHTGAPHVHTHTHARSGLKPTCSRLVDAPSPSLPPQVRNRFLVQSVMLCSPPSPTVSATC